MCLDKSELSVPRKWLMYRIVDWMDRKKLEKRWSFPQKWPIYRFSDLCKSNKTKHICILYPLNEYFSGDQTDVLVNTDLSSVISSSVCKLYMCQFHWFCFSQNIGYVNPTFIYFHYLCKQIWIKVSQKKNKKITAALASSTGHYTKPAVLYRIAANYSNYSFSTFPGNRLLFTRWGNC